MKFTKLALVSSVLGDTLDALYWTETNEKFDVDTHHRVSVKIGDKMDLICPRVGDGMDHNNHMYHRIYQVDEESFRNCDASRGKRLIDCNKPEQEKKYTVLFQDTNPSPYGLEFTPGVTYYYISTSSGVDLDGLQQVTDGGCRTNNMKLAIEVEEEESFYATSPNEQPVDYPTEKEITSQIVSNIADDTTPGSLLMGVGLGAFGVLLLVLIILAALRLYRKRHPSNDKMLYMSPVDVSRVPLPVHPVVDVKGPIVGGQVQGTYHVAHHGATHQASPPPPYGMSYTTLVPCNIHPSQMNLTHDSQSDHSTNHSYLTRDSFPIHNGDVCEV